MCYKNKLCKIFDLVTKLYIFMINYWELLAIITIINTFVKYDIAFNNVT